MPDALGRLQAALADRYHVEHELGRGGMATVYLARDLKHDRSVALKVLSPELATALGPERFLREIRTAARLQHPHILPVHDSGKVDNRLWYTMPYVEGESLRDRLRREVQLPLDEAVAITREVALALDYAHRQGVVHRDVKPENIMLSQGHPLVADFGVAQALAVDGERLTETGMAVGTPAYISPEQASGGGHVDARSDVYSLGCVLYEMLAGEAPFTGPTPQAVIARCLTETPRRLRVVRDRISPALEEAVSRAMARVPADRFTTAAEFAHALTEAASGSVQPIRPGGGTRRLDWGPLLRATLGALALALLAGVVILATGRTGDPERTPTGPKMLAVLPFENLGRTEDQYFVDGVTDDVRGKLAALPGLGVIAGASSGEYKGTRKPLQQIARELGVRYLVMGKVRRERVGPGSRVRVSPELVEVGTRGPPIARWQQVFETPLTDVFDVHAGVAGGVAEALGVAPGAGEAERLAKRPTTNLAAYEAYLKAEEISDGVSAGDRVALRRALPYYEQAIALDSGFAQAWAQLSRAHSLLYVNGTPTPAEAEAARRAAERALALAGDRPEGRLALGNYYAAVKQDYRRALEQYALGLRLMPNNADLLTHSAFAEQGLGRWESALDHFQQAHALDPRSVTTAQGLARALLWLRRYPEALQATDSGLALAPTSLRLLQTKVMVHLATSDLASARTVLRAAPREVEPAALVAHMAYYWDLYWVLDDAQQALLFQLQPSAFDDDRGDWGIVLAQTHALRGEPGKARAYADSARLAFEEQLRASPEDSELHLLHGLALAYLGRRDEAVREGEGGLALSPIAKDAYLGAYSQHQLARIYLLLGEPDEALDRLEPLLKIPYYLSPGWLQIDPTWDPLRSHPRFRRLVEGTG